MPFKFPWAKTYKHPCPDGSTKTVYRDINEIFPLYIKGFEGKAETKLNDITGTSVNLNAEYTTKIQGLLYSLDELNRNIMMSSRNAYIGYTADPCKYHDFLIRQMEIITQDQNRLTQLKIKIRGLIEIAELNPNHPEKVYPVYEQIVNQIGGPSIAMVAKGEIVESRTIAKKWIGDQYGS